MPTQGLSHRGRVERELHWDRLRYALGTFDVDQFLIGKPVDNTVYAERSAAFEAALGESDLIVVPLLSITGGYCVQGSAKWIDAHRADGGGHVVLWVGKPCWSKAVPNLRRRPYRITQKLGKKKASRTAAKKPRK